MYLNGISENFYPQDKRIIITWICCRMFARAKAILGLAGSFSIGVLGNASPKMISTQLDGVQSPTLTLRSSFLASSILMRLRQWITLRILDQIAQMEMHSTHSWNI